MEYTLRFTTAELDTIAAVRGKYCTGDIFDLLSNCCAAIEYLSDGTKFEDYVRSFTNPRDIYMAESLITEIEYIIPSYAAYAIIGLCKLEDYLYPLWNKELVSKFEKLIIDVIGFRP